MVSRRGRGGRGGGVNARPLNAAGGGVEVRTFIIIFDFRLILKLFTACPLRQTT